MMPLVSGTVDSHRNPIIAANTQVLVAVSGSSR